MPCGQEDIAAMTGYTLGGGYQPPAGGTVHLAHSGGYVIYYEGPGARSRNIPSFNVHLTPASPGASVSGLSHYPASGNYSVGSHDGRAVLALNIARPGKFAITASGGQGAGADLAVGGSVARGIVGVVLPAVPLMILAVIGGLIVFVIRIAGKAAMRRGQIL